MLLLLLAVVVQRSLLQLVVRALATFVVSWCLKTRWFSC